MKKRIRSYAMSGLTLFLTVVAFVIFYDSVFASHTLLRFFDKLFHSLLPVLYGCAMAYLLLPVMDALDSGFRSRFPHGADGEVKHPRLIRALAVLLAWLAVSTLIYALVSLVLPEIAESVNDLALNLEGYYNEVYGWATRLFDNKENTPDWIFTSLNFIYEKAEDWLRDSVLPQATALMELVGSGIVGIFRFLLNFVVGIIVSVYLLCAKESWAAGARRLIAALFSEEHQRLILRATHRVDTIFSGFIRGKLLDSLIIGILCFLLCSLLKIPYAPIVGLIVGITNIIPFFGPFLGAIPSALLILVASPKKCLVFILLIFALQQFDGNILGPRILGGSTGISGISVIIAIMLGGGFFGVAGMFFGVPVFACLSAFCDWLIREKLRRKGLSTELSDYGGLDLPGGERPGDTKGS